MEVDDNCLKCAFVLADRPDTHRPDVPDAVTKEEAYKPVACQMWAEFGSYASTQGYSVFGGEECPVAQ